MASGLVTTRPWRPGLRVVDEAAEGAWLSPPSACARNGVATATAALRTAAHSTCGVVRPKNCTMDPRHRPARSREKIPQPVVGRQERRPFTYQYRYRVTPESDVTTLRTQV